MHLDGRLLTFLAIGCGGAASDPMKEDETVGEAAAEMFTLWRTDRERALCERRQRCESPAPFSSVDACVAASDEDLRAATPRIADSIVRGGTKYFADAAAECLAIHETSCSTSYIDILIVCNKAYEGQQAAGESCVGHFECGGPSGPDRLLCFDGCSALFGYEDVVGAGQCVQGRPDGC